MAGSPKSAKRIDALKHDAAKRRNIPAAEMESFFQREDDPAQTDLCFAICPNS
jgi:adenine-specific DNA-methyltransferase